MACLLLVGAGCGGSSDPLDPEAYFAALDDHVRDFARELESIDRQVADREWSVPDVGEDRAEPEVREAQFDFSASLQLHAIELYRGAWEGFLDEWRSLAPPDGIPELGAGFETGFGDYIAEQLIAAEEATMDALDAWSSRLEQIHESDTEGEREYREELLGLFSDEPPELAGEMDAALDRLDDAWDDLAGLADDAGYGSFENAADLRTDLDVRDLTHRSLGLVIDIAQALG